MKRVFVIILAIAAAAMGCRAQEVVEINSTRQAVKRTGDALLVAMPLATLTAVIVERDWQGLKQAAFSTATTLGASYLLKYTVHKMRPDRSDNHAFPSAHTAVMFANAAFVQRRFITTITVRSVTAKFFLPSGMSLISFIVMTGG